MYDLRHLIDIAGPFAVFQSACSARSEETVSVLVPVCYLSSQPECSVRRKEVGCFADTTKQRALPELLLTARDATSSVYFGENINWNDWANFIDRFTCECALMARQRNYEYFGIENYGECWSGLNANYSVHGPSGKCKVVKDYVCAFEACVEQEHGDVRLCFGGPMTLYVYAIQQKLPVNGGWSKWSNWSACSKLCRGGKKIKSRKCDNPAPANGGKKCKGRKTKAKKCNKKIPC
ncbi:hypothetical protein ACROYT_G008610 [Oculina patagonica]